MRLSWRGPLLCGSRHAAGARPALRGLAGTGVDVRVEHTPWARPPAVTASERAWLAARQGDDGPVDVLVQRTLARLLDPHVPARMRAGWIAVPTEPCDRETALRARAMDAVWVGSDEARDALIAAGVAPARVHVVPEPVAPEAARRGAEPPAALPRAGTVFAAWVTPDRDGGFDLLLRAWARAFGPGDDVALVVHLDVDDPAADGTRAGARAVAAIAQAGRDPDALAEVVLLPEALDADAWAGLLAGADALVDPAHALDDGRIAALARAAGLPRLARTVTDAEGWALDAVHAAEPPPGSVPGEDLRRPAPSEDALVDALRACHADPAARRRRGAAARARAGEHAPRAVAAVLVGHLEGLRPLPPPRAGGPPRLVLEGDLLGATSLAGVNQALLEALARRRDVEAVAVERDGRRREPLPAGGAVARAMSRPPGPGDVVVRHFHPPSFAAAGAGRLVQVVHWEFGPLPVAWRAGLAGADEVWVASEAVRAAVVDSGVPAGRVAVVPLGVDADAWAGAPPADLTDAPGYRFLFVGGLVWRKGADLLLEAYARAFTRHDDVTLVLKDLGVEGNYPLGSISARAAAMAADPCGPRVRLVSGALPARAMPRLYAACDCLVHPFRAEAFGLTMLEAAAAGLPVIAAGHGPVREFLDASCADLLPARDLRLDPDALGLPEMDAPARVGEVDVEELAAAMRRMASDPDRGRAMGSRGARVARTRTWDAAARVVAGRVRALLEPARTAA